MLPFNYSASNLSLSLTAGFTPALVLSASVSVADIDVSGGIGAYLDLPVLSAQINTLTNMTADCTCAGSWFERCALRLPRQRPAELRRRRRRAVGARRDVAGRSGLLVWRTTGVIELHEVVADGVLGV